MQFVGFGFLQATFKSVFFKSSFSPPSCSMVSCRNPTIPSKRILNRKTSLIYPHLHQRWLWGRILRRHGTLGERWRCWRRVRRGRTGCWCLQAWRALALNVQEGQGKRHTCKWHKQSNIMLLSTGGEIDMPFCANKKDKLALCIYSSLHTLIHTPPRTWHIGQAWQRQQRRHRHRWWWCSHQCPPPIPPGGSSPPTHCSCSMAMAME